MNGTSLPSEAQFNHAPLSGTRMSRAEISFLLKAVFHLPESLLPAARADSPEGVGLLRGWNSELICGLSLPPLDRLFIPIPEVLRFFNDPICRSTPRQTESRAP